MSKCPSRRAILLGAALLGAALLGAGVLGARTPAELVTELDSGGWRIRCKGPARIDSARAHPARNWRT